MSEKTLRRLHDEKEMHKSAYLSACKELRKMEAQRDALLQALKDVVAFTGAHGGPYAQARAAIKAVEEGK